MGIRTGLPETTAGFAVVTLPAAPLFTEALPALLSAAVLAAAPDGFFEDGAVVAVPDVF